MIRPRARRCGRAPSRLAVWPHATRQWRRGGDDPGGLYAPGELDLLAGQTVAGATPLEGPHRDRGRGFFDSGYLASGSTFSRTFASTGTSRTTARIHRSMRGVVAFSR